MEELINSLNRIDQWLRNNSPEVTTSFNPGITSVQMDRIASTLPIHLPQELSFLYQWHNGVRRSKFMFNALGGLHFFPLGDSIEEYKDHVKELKSFGLWRDAWFPLFANDSIIYFVICRKIEFLSSPIYINDSKEHFDAPFSQKYDSLTSMMQTFADCHEMNAFEWTDDRKFHCNKKILEECYQTYNPVSLSMEPVEEWGSLDN